MSYHIFVAKESRANERRVALTPEDTAQLIRQGHQVTVESHAGVHAGFSNNAYQSAGAKIKVIETSTLSSYREAFENINLIVRAKRPDYIREQLELQAIQPQTIMIGALDPLEKNTQHINAYHAANIIAYSIDQANLSPTDPMNVLAAMSRLTGRLALQDAVKKCKNKIKKIALIGFGEVGQSALNEAIKQQLPICVILRNPQKAQTLIAQGIETYLLEKESSLPMQQAKIRSIIQDVDIVITSARNAKQLAPLLIPISTLEHMKTNAVIVDLAISEGGNVEGSKHDQTITTNNGIHITNVSGYPKVLPQEASQLWSLANLHFISNLAKNNITLKPC